MSLFVIQFIQKEKKSNFLKKYNQEYKKNRKIVKRVKEKSLSISKVIISLTFYDVNFGKERK